MKNNHRLFEIIAVLRKYNVTRGVSPEDLEAMIEELGPTYIKLGQIMANRSDILPKKYTDALSKLQTDVDPLPFEVVEEVLSDEYGQNVYEIFEYIDEKPLGSASIAQVHRARLKDGRDVVIKVQRPGIYETMQNDIKLLVRAAKIAKVIGPKAMVDIVDVQGVIEEMWESTKKEMDFYNEAKNIERFAKNNKDEADLELLQVYKDYSTGKVLVMDYIGGYDLEAGNLEDEDKERRADIATKITRNYIKQIVEDGFFQADPHPGNVKVDGEKIAWIDLGMMGSLSKEDKNNLKKALSGFVELDGRKIGDAFLDLSGTKKAVNEAYYTKIDEILNVYASKDFEEIEIGPLLDEFFEVLRVNEISVPGHITMLMRGMMTIESLLLKLSPETKIMDVFKNYLGSKGLFMELKDRLEKGLRDVDAFTKAGLRVPVRLNELMTVLTRGRTKVNVEVTGTETLMAELAKMVNRLVMGIITAALLIGSSFIATTGMKPRILGIPALGFLGFLISFGLGAWIVLQMLIQNHELDHRNKTREKHERKHK